MVKEFAFDHVIGFVIDHHFNKAAIDELQLKIEKALENQDKLSFYLEISPGCEVKNKALLEHMIFVIKHKEAFNKVAVVSSNPKVFILGRIKNFFDQAEVRNFKHASIIQAMNWVTS